MSSDMARQQRFQFHKGTIRTLNLSIIPTRLAYFNSIKVQLELYDKNSLIGCDAYFNSIKVQLEQGHELYDGKKFAISIP